MSYLILLLALAANPGEAEPRPYHLISADLKEVMRAEALAKTQSDRAVAIHQMSVLYRELIHDPRLETAPTLKSYKAKLWSRLVRVKKKLEIKLAHEQRGAGPPVADTARQQQDLQQQQATSAASQELAEHMTLASYTLGGPSRVIAEAGLAFGGGVRDDSAALIELIERTISPEFWETNGGPGSMFYYAPVHALVVSATQEVHDNVGGALRALRRAGM